MAKKERIPGVDFIRVICAVGIIMFHFSCHSASNFRLLYSYANGTWGSVLVAIFFMLSGGMLIYNYSKIHDLKLFYYKRAKSIFPAFYIGFAYYYMEMAFASGTPFFMGNPLKLIETLCGMDGYLLYRSTGNYYQIGEWFLGAIILLYILYPLINWAMNQSVLITSIISFILYVWILQTNFFIIPVNRNLISCFISFYIGMLFIRYKDFFLKNNIVLLVAFIQTVCLCAIRIPVSENIIFQLLGAALFIVLYRFGVVCMRLSFATKIIAFLSALSYPIFLLQHKIIINMQKVSNPIDPPRSIVMCMLTIVVTIIYAMVLNTVTNAVLKSKPFLFMEEKIYPRVSFLGSYTALHPSGNSVQSKQSPHRSERQQ